MTTVLTETGWANAETGEILGEWTDNTDKVDEGDEIIVPLEVVANTLGGNDIITGTSTDDLVLGISNQGTIDTGEGKDTISGTGGDIGILTLSGTIDTGKGDDTVNALNGGFAGGGTIDLGRGDDLIRGFGEQEVFGGRAIIDRGIDTAELGIDFDDQIELSNAVGSSIDITFDGATMAFTDVELFDFNGDEFTLRELQDLA